MSELNLILIGPPGAGKGTQADRIQDDFDLPYLATGDMMRAKRTEDSDLGRKISRIITEGGLVDDDIVCEVLIERIEAEGEDGFLLDGFPRTQGQADILDDALDRRSRAITAVLLIEVADEIIEQRVTGRRMCPDGHVYHVDFNPPEQEGVCDVDGKDARAARRRQAGDGPQAPRHLSRPDRAAGRALRGRRACCAASTAPAPRTRSSAHPEDHRHPAARRLRLACALAGVITPVAALAGRWRRRSRRRPSSARRRSRPR